MVTVRIFFPPEVAEFVNGKTFEEIENALARGEETSFQDYYEYFSKLTQDYRGGPAFPKGSFTFEANFSETNDDNYVAVYVTFDLIDIDIEAIFGGTSICLRSYGEENATNTIIPLLLNYLGRKQSLTEEEKVKIAVTTSQSIAKIPLWAMGKVEVEGVKLYVHKTVADSQEVFSRVENVLPHYLSVRLMSRLK